jgi:hypothetical protein
MNENLNEFGAQLTKDMHSWASGQLRDDAFPFDTRALDLFRLQYQAVTPYQQWCNQSGISPQSITSWNQIPVIPASSFKQLDWTSIPEAQRVNFFASSGTTGERRSHHHHGKESLKIYETSLLASFERLFLSMTNSQSIAFRFGFLVPPSLDVPHSSLAHMMETIRRKWDSQNPPPYLSHCNPSNLWVLNEHKIRAFFHKISENPSIPVCLMGTAFSFIHLLDWGGTERLSLELPQGSVILETGGYKGQSREVTRVELHQMIASTFKIGLDKIVTEYGMSELSSQAYRRPGSPPNPFCTPPWMRIRIINPEDGREALTGQTGMIQIFDLANVYSVMALETEDLGSSWTNGFELYGRASTSEPKGCSLFESGLSSGFIH